MIPVCKRLVGARYLFGGVSRAEEGKAKKRGEKCRLGGREGHRQLEICRKRIFCALVVAASQVGGGR